MWSSLALENSDISAVFTQSFLHNLTYPKIALATGRLAAGMAQRSGPRIEKLEFVKHLKKHQTDRLFENIMVMNTVDCPINGRELLSQEIFRESRAHVPTCMGTSRRAIFALHVVPVLVPMYATGKPGNVLRQFLPQTDINDIELLFINGDATSSLFFMEQAMATRKQITESTTSEVELESPPEQPGPEAQIPLEVFKDVTKTWLHSTQEFLKGWEQMREVQLNAARQLEGDITTATTDTDQISTLMDLAQAGNRISTQALQELAAHNQQLFKLFMETETSILRTVQLDMARTMEVARGSFAPMVGTKAARDGSSLPPMLADVQNTYKKMVEAWGGMFKSTQNQQ